MSEEIILFHAATRGGKWEIKVTQCENPLYYSGAEYKNDSQRGGYGGKLEYTKRKTAQIIHDSAFCKENNYIIKIDKMGIAEELALHNKLNWYPASRVNEAINESYTRK